MRPDANLPSPTFTQALLQESQGPHVLGQARRQRHEHPHHPRRPLFQRRRGAGHRLAKRTADSHQSLRIMPLAHQPVPCHFPHRHDGVRERSHRPFFLRQDKIRMASGDRGVLVADHMDSGRACADPEQEHLLPRPVLVRIDAPGHQHAFAHSPGAMVDIEAPEDIAGGMGFPDGMRDQWRNRNPTNLELNRAGGGTYTPDMERPQRLPAAAEDIGRSQDSLDRKRGPCRRAG